jgi:transcriptional regulator with XRE-family HTH domain
MHLQEARISRRVRVDDLAEAVGVSNSTISRWQKGDQVPAIEQKRKIAGALGLDMRSISYGVPTNGFHRRNIHPSKSRTLADVAAEAEVETVPAMPDTMAGVRVKNAKQATDRVRAELASENGRIPHEADVVMGKSDPNLTHAPEAFDSSTWSVIRRMIETIGADEAIRRLMKAP